MLFSSGTNSLSFVVCSTLLLLYYLVVPTEVKQWFYDLDRLSRDIGVANCTLYTIFCGSVAGIL